MKKLLLLILTVYCNSLSSQTTIIHQNSKEQLDYFNSNYTELKDADNVSIINSLESESYTLNGDTINSYFGISVSEAGDVNGDGYSDIIVGASAYSNSKGRAYIFYGGEIMDNIADVIMTGEAIYDNFGISVSSAGDVNGDGFSDVIVGARSNFAYGINTGTAYIYYGSYIMNNVADVVLNGNGTLQNASFGYSVSNAGDVNGDGYSDVIVGAYGQNSYLGKAYVFFGGLLMDNIADVTLFGERTGGEDVYFGFSVSYAGDVNNDGYSDILVGAYGYDYTYGRAYIYYGSSNMDNVADVIITGNEFRGRFGNSVSNAGDVNGDGFDDVIIGQYSSLSYTGKSYIFYGGSLMDNVEDVIMVGESKNIQFGYSVSSAGDVNGDGYSDVIVGSISINRAYIFYGDSVMDNSSDIILTGNNSFGSTVTDMSDINGDGYSDVLVGVPAFNSGTGQVCICTEIAPKTKLISPLNNSSNNLLNVNFSWNKLISTNYYVLIISTDSDFNNVIYNDTLFNDTNKAVSGFQKGIKYYWKIRSKDSSGFTINSSTWNFTTIHPIYSNIKILFEGLYNSSFNQLLRKDSVTAFLRSTSTPFNIIDSAKVDIDTISLSGSFNFYSAISGTYYISVRHFNSIETWSKIGGEYLSNNGSNYNYDFSSSISQAFGNNLKLKGSKYCLFSGDVTQDGYINLSDVILINNDASNFTSGSYLVSDLTGDNIVDLTDVTLCSNNAVNFVSVIRP